jgi:hypothetical protein
MKSGQAEIVALAQRHANLDKKHLRLIRQPERLHCLFAEAMERSIPPYFDQFVIFRHINFLGGLDQLPNSDSQFSPLALSLQSSSE